MGVHPALPRAIKDPIVAANGVEADVVRIIAPDVGGGFGAKIGTYPEEILLGPIAKRIGRPVTWRETRSESMMASATAARSSSTSRSAAAATVASPTCKSTSSRTAVRFGELGTILPGRVRTVR